MNRNFKEALTNFAFDAGAGKAIRHLCDLGRTAEQIKEEHMIFVERVEDEYYVRIDHAMTKTHYISFIAAVSADRCQMVKLYPEGNAEARFKIDGVKKILFYCNRDGLFSLELVKGIDDKDAAYEDTQERRELEKAADMLFGKRAG